MWTGKCPSPLILGRDGSVSSAFDLLGTEHKQFEMGWCYNQGAQGLLQNFRGIKEEVFSGQRIFHTIPSQIGRMLPISLN